MGARYRVMVGMSGGVDSSVAALLLHRAGFEVSGLFMKNWEEDHRGPCPAEIDARDALDACERIGIPLDAANFAAEYRERVFREFLAEYGRGRTPNPDIWCNKEIKFRAFLDYALAQGAERIATGHYARVEERGGRYRLLKGRDERKDQSYFLYRLAQDQLARTLFPLGDLAKTEVRGIAAQAGFANHAKKDSTGICFIGERAFKPFLRGYLPSAAGEIRTLEGAVVGMHEGLLYYTLGQRRGLGIGGRRAGSGAPWYVVGKDLERNVLYVAQGYDHPALFSSGLSASRVHWVAGRAPRVPLYCQARIRYRQADQACAVTAIDGGRLQVTFERPQWAVTPGQSVVFYARDECLGGAVIDDTVRCAYPAAEQRCG